MNIWILHNSEILPIDGANVRIQRTGIIGSMLQEKGNKVTWWTSTFDHLKKIQRYNEDTVIDITENYKIKLLKTPGYSKNISLSRLIDHDYLARRFYDVACKMEEFPDLIFSGFPTIDFCKVAIKFGKEFNIPVIIDVRDYWPEVFLAFLPKPLRFFGKLVLYKFFSDSRYVFRNATAIFGHAPDFVEFGLKKAKRLKTEFDNDYPFGYKAIPINSSDIDSAVNFWDRLDIKNDNGYFNIIFLGTIGHMFDFEIVIDAYRKIRQSGRKIKLIICGKGEKVDFLKNIAKGNNDILFPGWVNATEINVLMKRSHLGLYPVLESEKGELFGSYNTIPNKVPEYLSGSLPVASSLSYGYLHDFIDENKIGFNYCSSSDLLSERISFLVDNQSEYEIFTNNALKVFNDIFDADKVYSRLITNMESVVSDYKMLKHAR